MEATGALFATLYASALLFHNQKPYVERDLIAAGLTVSALATIVQPAIAPLLVLAALFQIVQFWRRLPTAQTSEYLKALCGACIVTTYIALAIESGTPLVGIDAWYGRCAPLLRLLVCMMLLAAVLHKINWAFLKPKTSVAPHFLLVVLKHVGLPVSSRWPERLALLVPVMTLMIEGGAAMLLAWPPTRLAGVVVILAFFTIIAAQGITQFSSLMFALMVPFLSPGILTAIDSAAIHLGLQVGAVIYFPYAIYARVQIGSPATFLTLAGLFATTCLLAGAASGQALTTPDPIFGFSTSEVILLVAFWINELGPYVGFKDWPAFRMYSNLATGPAHNHVFIPRWLHLDRLRQPLLIVTGATLNAFYDATTMSYATKTRTPKYGPDEEFAIPLGDLGSLAASTLRRHADRNGTPVEYRDATGTSTATMRELVAIGRCRWRPGWLLRFLVFRPHPVSSSGEKHGSTPE
jgi:hypothetical protein